MVFGFMAGKNGAKVPVALLVGRAQYVSIYLLYSMLQEEEREADLAQLLRRPQHGTRHIRHACLSRPRYQDNAR